MLKFIKNIFFKKRSHTKVAIKFKSEDEGTGRAGFRFKKHFPQPRALSDIPFIYCLVGNIIEEHFNESEQKTFKGIKHFSPGTKVYCFPPRWGDGYEKIMVIGKHRKSTRLITMIIPSKHVTNWRLKTVYHPLVIKEMTGNLDWTDNESHKENIIKLAASLNER